MLNPQTAVLQEAVLGRAEAPTYEISSNISDIEGVVNEKINKIRMKNSETKCSAWNEPKGRNGSSSECILQKSENNLKKNSRYPCGCQTKEEISNEAKKCGGTCRNYVQGNGHEGRMPHIHRNKCSIVKVHDERSSQCKKTSKNCRKKSKNMKK